MQRQAPARRTPAAPAGHPHRTQRGRASRRPWTHNSHPQVTRTVTAADPLPGHLPDALDPHPPTLRYALNWPQLTSPRCSSALAAKVHRVGHAALGLGRPPALLAFAADAGSFAALGGQHAGVAGVGVAPAQVGLQPAGQRRVVRMVAGAHDKGPQQTEVRLHRISPPGPTPCLPRRTICSSRCPS